MISSKDSSPSGTCSIASVYKGWELYWAQDLSSGVRGWLEMKCAETLGLQETLARAAHSPQEHKPDVRTTGEQVTRKTLTDKNAFQPEQQIKDVAY